MIQNFLASLSISIRFEMCPVDPDPCRYVVVMPDPDGGTAPRAPSPKVIDAIPSLVVTTNTVSLGSAFSKFSTCVQASPSTVTSMIIPSMPSGMHDPQYLRRSGANSFSGRYDHFHNPR